jgi:hypothetical protein
MRQSGRFLVAGIFLPMWIVWPGRVVNALRAGCVSRCPADALKRDFFTSIDLLSGARVRLATI